MRYIFGLITIALCCFLVSACGESTDDNNIAGSPVNTPIPPNPEDDFVYGAFVDDLVVNLGFFCNGGDTYFGRTSADNVIRSFGCPGNSTSVTFFIGNVDDVDNLIIIGNFEFPTDPASYVELFQISFRQLLEFKTLGLSDPKILNRARLLQALDSDGVTYDHDRDGDQASPTPEVPWFADATDDMIVIPDAAHDVLGNEDAVLGCNGGIETWDNSVFNLETADFEASAMVQNYLSAVAACSTNVSGVLPSVSDASERLLSNTLSLDAGFYTASIFDVDGFGTSTNDGLYYTGELFMLVDRDHNVMGIGRSLLLDDTQGTGAVYQDGLYIMDAVDTVDLDFDTTPTTGTPGFNEQGVLKPLIAKGVKKDEILEDIFPRVVQGSLSLTGRFVDGRVVFPSQEQADAAFPDLPPLADDEIGHFAGTDLYDVASIDPTGVISIVKTAIAPTILYANDPDFEDNPLTPEVETYQHPWAKLWENTLDPNGYDGLYLTLSLYKLPTTDGAGLFDQLYQTMHVMIKRDGNVITDGNNDCSAVDEETLQDATGFQEYPLGFVSRLFEPNGQLNRGPRFNFYILDTNPQSQTFGVQMFGIQFSVEEPFELYGPEPTGIPGTEPDPAAVWLNRIKGNLIDAELYTDEEAANFLSESIGNVQGVVSACMGL